MNLEDGKILIRLARLAIETYFSGKLVNLPEADKFKEKQGVFVTLNMYDKLRGCIGFPYPTYSLKRSIVEAARSAAFRDPRFRPLVSEELEDTTIEVSVLSIPEMLEGDPTEYLDRIKIGKHGLIIKSGFSSGLLLPQVFTEYESTPKEALEMVCEKAGLDNDDWTRPESQLFTFTATIFKEEEPSGKIIQIN